MQDKKSNLSSKRTSAAKGEFGRSTWNDESLRDRPALGPVLANAQSAARIFSISERAFHNLRRRDDFPKDATVFLSERCVRFRVEALHQFAEVLASKRNRPEPTQLQRSRALKKTLAEIAASAATWPASSSNGEFSEIDSDK
jgi:hypothetical protein